MPNLNIIVGLRFGRLVVVERKGASANSRHSLWLCCCDCGEEKVVPAQRLTNGQTKSCGCWRRDLLSTHKRSRTALYKAWYAMLYRCRNPRAKAYKYYGGRGIGVWPEWDFVAFAAYVDTHLGPRPPGMSLDRIDNDRGYEPGNLRWATRKQQRANRRPISRGRSKAPPRSERCVPERSQKGTKRKARAVGSGCR